MRFITVALLLLSTIQTYAQNVYLNYGQWEQMPTSLRERYIAGTFDALSTVSVPENAAVSMRYNECIAKIGMSSGQLAENMKGYAGTQTDLQDKPTPGVLMRSLTSVCGLPQ